MLVAGAGFEPACAAYETAELPLLYPAIDYNRYTQILNIFFGAETLACIALPQVVYLT